MSSRLDQVFATFEERLETADHISISEPFAADNPPAVGSPLRALTISVNRQPFALLGLTEPTLSPKKSAFVIYVARRARARRLPFIVLCNERETILVKTPKRDDEQLETMRHYPPILTLAPTATDLLEQPEQIAIAQLADSVAKDLYELLRDGRLDMVLPDSDFFVGRLTRAVDVLKPAVKQALQTKLSMDPKFAQAVTEWAVPQGIPADLRAPEFAEAVVRQSIYRLLGKIIFYQSLRRAAPQLPEMDLAGLDTGQVLTRLAQCFAEAHKIDYHAVFREDVIDRLPFPAAASSELRDLVGDLNTRDFAHLPQDVVGAVFERLIPPEDRHALGQFFTRESLVDLIVAFCVRNADDSVMDPTCGTGTFLIRSYNCLNTRLGVHNHNRLLSQLWGVDIAPFPAELATINLFRQRVSDPGNFPRIINEDFFKIVPHGTYRFPPLKADTENAPMVDEVIPAFDVILGNFPYISADRIEQTIKNYRAVIDYRLASDWLSEYPAGFTFKTTTQQKEFDAALKKKMPVTPFLEKAEPIISSYADMYVSLFWHAAAFLKLGGRMGIITNNAWLDVGYGYALQRFLLDNFKLIAVLESRCEPWFEQAAVNTVVTIVERTESATERDGNPARFVKIKKPLAELVPWDMHTDALARWNGLIGHVQHIESAWDGASNPNRPKTVEDDNFRVRIMEQGVLRKQVEEAEQTVKWGSLLRAPQIYFDLLQKAHGKLALLREIAPPTFGSKTGINEFFHMNKDQILAWQIEDDFLFPLLKSPGDSDRLLIDIAELDLKVFVCRLTKEELKRKRKLNALRYIEWGEEQRFASGAQAGMTWPNGAEVRNRKPGWYALPEYRSQSGQLFISMAYGARYINKYSPTPLIADNRLYFLSPVKGVSNMLMAAVMNASITSLMMELTGRTTLGDGALEFKVEDARDYLLVPNAREFDLARRQEIESAFKPLLKRPIGSVFEEVKQSDHQALDRAVLKAMGLDSEKWLPRIYEGLTTLVRERIQLGQMRGQSRRNRTQKAASRVSEEVLQDILPNGPKKFPNDFLPPTVRSGEFREISLPTSPLRHKGHWMGKEELATEDGETLHASNKFEMRYILYAQGNGQPVARLPKQSVEISRAVTAYQQYLRDLRERLHQAYFTRTLDQAAATRFVGEIWRKLGLPQLEE